MSDLIQAKTLLDASYRDLKALSGMSNTDFFSDEVFGFHVQQSIEKSLKAWLALLGKVYPYTHDLSLLLKKLEALDCHISDYTNLIEYSAFAGQVRYVGLCDDDNPIDRTATLTQVGHLYEQVNQALQAAIKSNSEEE